MKSYHLFLFFFCLSGNLFAQTKNPRLALFHDADFFIKGAGIDNNGTQYFKEFKEAGGNTFRTWRSDNATAEFDSAEKYNLKVALGIGVGQELHGFDYNDKEAVKAQFESIKKEVLQYKEEPQLLCWVVGNELNLLLNEKGELSPVNPKVYDALEDIIQFIHSVDSLHPVTTTFAGFTKEHVTVALTKAPSLDFLSFQVYGDLINMNTFVQKAKLTKPFIISEYGPLGHWERPSTSWDREIEETSTEKAIGLKERITKAYINNKNPLFLGSFAFLWGQKQERTPTWYGMFLTTGESDARVDELTKYWTGSYPKNTAPKVHSFVLNNKKAIENIKIETTKNNLTASVQYSDAEEDNLSIKWELLKEVEVKSQGGSFELKPDSIPLQIEEKTLHNISFKCPKEEGQYRLFVYVFDKKGKVGTANIPFLIDAKIE